MPQGTIADAFSDLCRKAAYGPDALPDGELLRRYAEARDEGAFAALVRRHGRVVWGAALRRTADRQAAEDVFQATFLALARRAGRLDGRTSLAGWLYTVGSRLARRAARRSPAAPVEHSPDPRPGPLADLSARELLTAIDDELNRLPERLRLPVVLCCLDGLSRDEAAMRLGCSFQVLKGRLERGRDLLRKRLTRRGLSLPAALGGLVVLPLAVPPEVTAAATSAVLTSSARPAVTALAGSLGHARPGLVLVVMAGLLGLGLALMPAGAPPKADEQPPAREPAPSGDTVALRILQDGRPVAGAQVWVAPRHEKDKPAPILAGPDGVAHVPVETEGGRRSLSVFARGPAGHIGEARIYDYELHSERGPVVHLLPVGEVTGRLTTTNGKPIAGAELRASQFNRTDDGHEPQRPNYLSAPGWDPTYHPKTDADGRFRIPGAPVGYRAHVAVKTDGFGQGHLRAEAGKPIAVTLAPAGTIRLRLGGPGDPAATKGLTWSVYAAPDPGKAAAPFVGSANGTFDGSAEVRIPNLPPGKYSLRVPSSAQNAVRVVAAGEVTVSSNETADVPATVEPLVKTTGRLVDARTGKGIPKATVYLSLRDQRRAIPHYGHVETDADGRFVAYGPPGEWARPFLNSNTPPAGYSLSHEEFQAVQLDPKTPVVFPDIKLRPTITLTGLVVDESGHPVAGPAARSGRIHSGNGYRLIRGKPDGTFTIPNLDPDDVVAPRVKHGNAVNVPTPVAVGKQDGPVKITVSEKNGCRVRGRVTDAAGKPLAGATVGVSWHYWGLGRESQYGTSWGVERLTTEADGRFESGPWWPGDKYNVSVTRDGYGKSESKQVQGEAGQVHDLGTIALVPTGLSVRGRVVGTDGKPLAGVTVFNRGDGPGTMTATTGPDGNFTLTGFFDAPGFVFAKKDGYRFAHVEVRPGGEPVTVTLRTTAEPPVALPPMDDHRKALDNFTRWLLERLWAERAHLGGFERNVFRAMARFDPATARKWRDDEKTRTGGKVDLTKTLEDEEREQKLLKLAADDLDEALALIPQGKGRWDVDPVLDLGHKLLKTDKAKALRAADEAAARARSLDPESRAWVLARVGDLAIRAGNAAGGKKLVAEAADLIGSLPADDRHRQTRTEVAAVVAPHDEPRAHRLIDAFKGPDHYSWALAGMISRIAEFDPDRAEALLPRLRPELGFADSEARLAIAYQVGETDPDRAERLVNGTPRATYRILGLSRLATLVKDRDRAWKLIDRAMAQIEERPGELHGWSSSGGAAGIAAVVAVRARMVGHPDVAGLVGRAPAQRPTEREESRKTDRDQQAVAVASVLAFADPAAARGMLAAVAPPTEYAKRAAGERREWLFAAAVADPDGAKAVVEAVWAAGKSRRDRGPATAGTGLIELVSILTDPGGPLDGLADYGQALWKTDRPR